MIGSQKMTRVAAPSSGDTLDCTSRLAMSLRSAITKRVGRHLQDLRVTPSDGNLLVHGRVPTYYLKQLVIAAAMRFSAANGASVVFDLKVISCFDEIPSGTT